MSGGNRRSAPAARRRSRRSRTASGARRWIAAPAPRRSPAPRGRGAGRPCAGGARTRRAHRPGLTASISTRPAALRTRPARPSSVARRHTNGRNPTPWTTPSQTRALVACARLAAGTRTSGRTVAAMVIASARQGPGADLPNGPQWLPEVTGPDRLVGHPLRDDPAGSARTGSVGAASGCRVSRTAGGSTLGVSGSRPAWAPSVGVDVGSAVDASLGASGVGSAVGSSLGASADGRAVGRRARGGIRRRCRASASRRRRSGGGGSSGRPWRMRQDQHVAAVPLRRRGRWASRSCASSRTCAGRRTGCPSRGSAGTGT